MARSYIWNAYETSLDGSITAVADTISLASVVGLRAPGYLVIEKDDGAKREYISFTGISGSDLTGVARGMPGSVAGAQAHDGGKLVHSIVPHQLIDDIFTDIEANAADILLKAPATHVDSTDGHPLVTVSADGLMAKGDKTTLDTIAPQVAQNITDIGDLTTDTDANTAQLAINTPAIIQNTADIGTNDTEIAALQADALTAESHRVVTTQHGLSSVSITSTTFENVIDYSPNIVPADWVTYSVEARIWGRLKKASGNSSGNHLDMVTSVLLDGGLGTYAEYNELLNTAPDFAVEQFTIQCESADITRATRPIPQIKLDAKVAVASEQITLWDLGYHITVWRKS